MYTTVFWNILAHRSCANSISFNYLLAVDLDYCSWPIFQCMDPPSKKWKNIPFAKGWFSESRLVAESRKLSKNTRIVIQGEKLALQKGYEAGHNQSAELKLKETPWKERESLLFNHLRPLPHDNPRKKRASTADIQRSLRLFVEIPSFPPNSAGHMGPNNPRRASILGLLLWSLSLARSQSLLFPGTRKMKHLWRCLLAALPLVWDWHGAFNGTTHLSKS